MTKKLQDKVWEGVYDSFDETDTSRNVFEGDIWLDKISARARSLNEAADTKNPVSPIATTKDYALPFIAATMTSDKPLRILDFGGGMGTSYIPLKKMLPETQKFEYTLVDNTAVCEKGREVFENETDIEFATDFEDGRIYDIAHVGSTIHYVEDWQKLQQRLIDTQAEYILFTDLPAGAIKTFVTAQTFHDKTIPVRFWNYNEFIDLFIKTGYEVILKSRYQGYYLADNENLPTDNFDEDHRLEYFIQLVLKKQQ